MSKKKKKLKLIQAQMFNLSKSTHYTACDPTNLRNQHPEKEPEPKQTKN